VTLGGWIFMTLSVSFVTILCAWCFYRVLTLPDEPPRPMQEFHSA
jgi:hypothetical protein